jgi:hypothetical protein
MVFAPKLERNTCERILPSFPPYCSSQSASICRGTASCRLARAFFKSFSAVSSVQKEGKAIVFFHGGLLSVYSSIGRDSSAYCRQFIFFQLP